MYCLEDELHEDAYMRKIGELLAVRMKSPFDYVVMIQFYIRSAEEQYGVPPEQTRRALLKRPRAGTGLEKLLAAINCLTERRVKSHMLW